MYCEPPDPADNRWQRGAVVEALYFADSEPTAWAEWYRYLAEAALPPQQALPRDLWRWEISLSTVADLSNPARLARVGLPNLQPKRHRWPDFQRAGEQLHDHGWGGVLSACAARPEGQTLCVFRTSRKVSGTRPIPPPTTVTDPPAVPTGMQTWPEVPLRGMGGSRLAAISRCRSARPGPRARVPVSGSVAANSRSRAASARSPAARLFGPALWARRSLRSERFQPKLLDRGFRVRAHP